MLALAVAAGRPAPGHPADDWTLFLPLLGRAATPDSRSPATVTTTPTRPPTPSPTPTATPLSPSLTLIAIADTFVTEGRADATWGAYPGLFIGYDYQQWRRQRVLLRFDLAGLPRDTLAARADLQVYVHNCFECLGGEIRAYRVTQAWDEATATWLSHGEALAEGYGATKLDPASLRRWVRLDVTDLVNRWLTDTPNHGVMLRGIETPVSAEPLRYDFWGIEAREGVTRSPRLVVQWAPTR